MDIVLAVLAVLLAITGLVGSIIQIIPGPILGFAGVMLLHFSQYGKFSIWFLIIAGVVAVAASILDNVLTAMGAKGAGASDRASWGATIGVIVGIFVFPPLGMIVLAFIGALIGELTAGKKAEHAVKASFGTLVGFILGTVLKVSISAAFIFYIVIRILKFHGVFA